MTSAVETRTEDRDLVLTRFIAASPDKVYRAWSEPDLLKQWFAPKPFETPVADLDVRPGGASRIVMRGPDGTDMPNTGVYLEVVPNRRIAFTDAFCGAGWEPSEKPFMTVVLTFEPEGAGTRYTARVRHGTTADREMHEQMGFHQGWAICADQLAALAEGLA